MSNNENTTPPAHKRNFENFIEPKYARVASVNPGAQRDRFQVFHEENMACIPDEGSPADPYMYNAWMGEYARLLDQAKDAYVKAALAFYTARGSGASPS